MFKGRKISAEQIKRFISKPSFDEGVILNNDPSYPKISIITPSYNQAQFLEKTILSVLNQNYPNLEYIVIDGGSTDRSVEIIKKYEKYLTYWISEKDNGQTNAINKGFKKASGDILAWLNSDDILLPETLLKVAKVFQSSSHLDLIYSDVLFMDHNDRHIGERRYVKFRLLTLLTDCNICQPTAFWKRTTYKKVGGLNPQRAFCMDYDLFIKIAMAGKVKHIRDYFACARLHKDTKTSNLRFVYLEERAQIQREFYPHFNNKLIFAVHRFWSRACRLINHIFQGDCSYLIKQFAGRPSCRWKRHHQKDKKVSR